MTDSWQIDVQMARLLLERTLYEGDELNAFINFEKAHRILCSNKTPERHYPLRQVSLYKRYYKRFYNIFSATDKVAFQFFCIEIQKQVQVYLNAQNCSEKGNRKKNREIRAINDDLAKMLENMK